jgi:hypothetical protein
MVPLCALISSTIVCRKENRGARFQVRRAHTGAVGRHSRSVQSDFCCQEKRPAWSELGTFLRNHAPTIAAMNLFVVPTIGLELLYALVIVRLERRGLVWINVRLNPTAESIGTPVRGSISLA